MKLHYIHPTITTIAIEPSSLMEGSGSAKNQILLMQEMAAKVGL